MDQSNIVYMSMCILADIDDFTAKYTEKKELESSSLNI